ncbi:hypothetical protein [Echinicola vietnamensis]|uniref:Uncharacterized protein n=1 Tax=Echinicola vietnamensis (strain DSM 17526 / LMG 23754 / KMM 6221) TaxID=926556 RepID=L0FVD2_ECHVK|nr:hypothetical protein [Echinicola vietnamensis]AGA76716.1 hypothetical protein Echvi_0430 [Echinicola vietnamensis DSM 17526]
MSDFNKKLIVSSVAKIFEVSSDTVKKWIKIFHEYLSSSAVPPKGTERTFEIEDIRVLAHIFSYWEDEPDIEYIKMGLNSNSHYDNELIDNLILQISPFVIEPNDKMDETWKHGVLFGGLGEIGDRFYLANSYKLAGDRLIETALQNEESWDLFSPAIYNYRHATELYLKDITNFNKENNNKRNPHDLKPLFEKFKVILSEDYGTTCPDWFSNVVDTFNKFDPGGTTFRYGERVNLDEVFIDFVQMKTLMGWMSKSFNKIRERQSSMDS